MRIEINHLARIEGHANLVVDSASGALKECRLEIVESPRFFESMLKGRHFSDVAPLVSRICGVCSVSHTLVSLAATERALGVEVTPQTLDLRRLLSYGEILQSHILQLYFMAVPDYLGVPSIFALVKSRRELVARALRLKRLGNRLCQVVGGRPVHPVTPRVGGFAALPEVATLQELRRELVSALPDLEQTVELFASLEIPELSRPTEGVSLGGEAHYPFMGEVLVSTAGLEVPVADYRTTIEEYLVSHSTAKFARLNGRSYMVGPLSRVRNAMKRLSPMAGTVARVLKLEAASENPYFAIVARLVEVVHFVEESIRLIDALLQRGLSLEEPASPEAPGVGVAAIEAPRGTLFHAYRYGRDGLLEEADCLIPTAQNLGSIEADLAAAIPPLIDGSREELSTRLEMLIRAYDPCISCSTHLLKVKFI